jgi:hypothetical protein
MATVIIDYPFVNQVQQQLIYRAYINISDKLSRILWQMGLSQSERIDICLSPTTSGGLYWAYFPPQVPIAKIVIDPLVIHHAVEYDRHFTEQTRIKETDPIIYVLCHELQHHVQHIEGRFANRKQKDGTIEAYWYGESTEASERFKGLNHFQKPWELEANAVAYSVASRVV